MADKNDKASSLPSEVEQIIERLPAENRKEIVQLFSMQSFMTRTPEGEISKKITESHIDKMLTLQEKSLEYEHEDEKQSKRYMLIGTIIAVGFIILLIVLLKDNPSLLEKVLTIIGSAGIGAFGGYGFGKSQKLN